MAIIAPILIQGNRLWEAQAAFHIVASILDDLRDRSVISTVELKSRISERAPYWYRQKNSYQRTNLLTIAMYSNGWVPWGSNRRGYRIKAWVRR